MLDPGESQRLDLGRVRADIRALCTLPGHELAGMSLEIQVDERSRTWSWAPCAPKESGQASGATNAIREIGGVLGVAAPGCQLGA